MTRKLYDILDGLSPRARGALRWAMIGALSGVLASLLLNLVGHLFFYIQYQPAFPIDLGPLKFSLRPRQFMPGLAFGLVMGAALFHTSQLSRERFWVYVLGCTLSFFAGTLIGRIPNLYGLVESRFLAIPLGGLAKVSLLMAVSAALMPAFRRPLAFIPTIAVGGGLSAILIAPQIFFPQIFDPIRSMEIYVNWRMASSVIWHAGIGATLVMVFSGREWSDSNNRGALAPDESGGGFTRRTRTIVRWALTGLLSGAIVTGLILLTKGGLFLIATFLPMRGGSEIFYTVFVFLMFVPVWPGPVFGLVMGRVLIRNGFLRPERYAGYVTIATLSYIAAGLATVALALGTEAYQPHNSRALPLVGFCGGLVGAGLLTALSAWIMPEIRGWRPAILTILAGGLAGGMLLQLETVFFIEVKGYLLWIIWPAAYAGALGATIPLTEGNVEPTVTPAA